MDDTRRCPRRLQNGGRAFWVVAAALCALFVVVPAKAQQAEISGFVKDPSQAVVANATVDLRNTATGTEQTTTTNEAGIYTIPVAQPGVYDVSVKASGFETEVQQNVTVNVAAKLNLNFALRVSTANQTVTVNGNQLYLNTTDASVSAVIDRDFVENIPLNGRSFQSLMTLVPGVAAVPSQGPGIGGELSVNGQRTEANYFTVDGVSANTGASAVSGTTGFGGGFAGATPAETVLGTTQSMVPLDDLEEFRTTTSTYSAEYGRTPGGQFIFNTRSGTNQLHGTVFDYLRNGAFDANNWFNDASDTPKQVERQNDFGGTLGGPVTIPGLYNGKDKTFFFASYEGVRLDSPQASTLTGVPSLSLRASAPAALQPILNAYPIPNGTDLGDGIAYFSAGYSSPSEIDTGRIRIDHNFSDNFKIFGRFSDTRSNTLSRDPNELSTVISSSVDVKSFTFGATNIISARTDNEFRFNITQNNANATYALDNFGGAQPFSLSQIPGLGGSSSDWFIFNLYYDINARLGIEPQATTQQQFNVTDTLTRTIGRHTLKFGIDYRRLNDTATLPALYEFGYVTDESQVITNQMEGAILKQASFPMEPFYTNFSAFIQDEWKTTSRLSISLGLRWEFDPPPGDSGGNLPYTTTNANAATAQVAPQGTPLWHTTYNNFAPRLGLAYQVRTKPGHETVLRTGFGVYYDLVTANASEGYGGIGASSSIDTSGTSFPFSQSDINSLPPAGVTTPYESTVFGFDPNLKLPYTLQYSLGVEQALGSKQSLTINYVGSVGRRLYINRLYYPSFIGNPNFDQGVLYLTTNGGSSEYNALQVSFQRKLSTRLQAFASYTLSHSMDDVSSNFFVSVQQWADSDFDVRHRFQGALTYSIPGKYDNPFLSSVLTGWSIDTQVMARTALPVDIESEEYYDAESGADVIFHPNLVPGQPIYIKDPSAPGGRVINYAAFQIATDSNGNPIEGDVGRNSARGFGAFQTDLAIHRDFPFNERVGLQFRAEAFNLFNNPNFGAIYNQLVDGPALFGRSYQTLNESLGGLNSLYQVGGPRSLQLSLKLHF